MIPCPSRLRLSGEDQKQLSEAQWCTGDVKTQTLRWAARSLAREQPFNEGNSKPSPVTTLEASTMPQIDSRDEAARGERSTWFFLRRLSLILRGRRPARDDERLVPRRPRSLAKRAPSDHVGASATLDLSRETRESPYSFLIGLVRYTESLVSRSR